MVGVLSDLFNLLLANNDPAHASHRRSIVDNTQAFNSSLCVGKVVFFWSNITKSPVRFLRTLSIRYALWNDAEAGGLIRMLCISMDEQCPVEILCLQSDSKP